MQMLDALQAVHSRGCVARSLASRAVYDDVSVTRTPARLRSYIHRDVKPANFTVGYGARPMRV